MSTKIERTDYSMVKYDLDPLLIQWASGFTSTLGRLPRYEAKAFSDMNLSIALKLWSQADIDIAISGA